MSSRFEDWRKRRRVAPQQPLYLNDPGVVETTYNINDSSLDDISDGIIFRKPKAGQINNRGGIIGMARGGNTGEDGTSYEPTDNLFKRGFDHLGDVLDGGGWFRTTANEKTGGARGFTALDTGGMVVPGSIDMARPYVNKHMGNIPDDPGSDRRAATANEKTGGARGYSNFNGVGGIAPGVLQYDSAASRVMMRGYQTGRYRNGAAVTFATPYANAPKVRVSGAQNNEPRSLWGTNGGTTAPSTAIPQIQDYGLDQTSRTGGVLRARLRQAGTTTAASLAWVGTKTVSLEGEVTAVMNPTAVANDGIYQITGTLAITQQYDNTLGGTQSVSSTVAMEIDPANNGAWVEVATKTLNRTATSTATAGTSSVALALRATRSDVTTVSGFRLKLKTFSDVIGVSSTTGTANSLDYTTATGEQYASATYDPLIDVFLEAWEGETST